MDFCTSFCSYFCTGSKTTLTYIIAIKRKTFVRVSKLITSFDSVLKNCVKRDLLLSLILLTLRERENLARYNYIVQVLNRT